ncbi:MAG: NmrA family NAD(P)-binding protein, partial [Bacteroidota bacterium]
MEKSKILITASTGNVGAPLVNALHNKQIPFTAATRNSENAIKKFGFEPETVFMDFRDISSFKPALENREILFLCGPSATPEAEEMLKPLVEEAIDQKIKYVVFIASYPSLMERIEKSKMDYTFIKANFFMQNFEMYQTEEIRDRNQIFMPTGEGKAPFIHTRDIGEVAAEIIENPDGYRKQKVYLTGPEALDHFQVADIFSEVLERKITYRNPDDETYRSVMKDRGFSDKYIDAMIAVFGKIKKGKVEQTSDMVEKILGRKPTTFKE